MAWMPLLLVHKRTDLAKTSREPKDDKMEELHIIGVDPGGFVPDP
jgi:hypothetical protein